MESIAKQAANWFRAYAFGRLSNPGLKAAKAMSTWVPPHH